MVDNQAFTKQRMSSDLITNAPPFFYFKALIYSNLCIENAQKTRVFFRFKFSVWRIEITGERHKAAKILRFAFPGDTAFMLKIGRFFAFQVKKK